MMRKFIPAILLALLLSLTASAQERYLKPIDEAAKDPSFQEFRMKLIEAVENRDAKYIVGILDPNITVSFGGHNGVADFKSYWKIDQRNSKFWDEFLRVISNGGLFSSEGSVKMFTAPYTFQGFPQDLDQFEHMAVFGERINLRERPDSNSPPVAVLSYNIVKVNHENSIKHPSDEQEMAWYRVETLGGKRGFIKSEFVRSPVDYRAGFQKKNGKWKMTFFVAGD